MENQIEVFEQLMLDYLKGKLSPEDTLRFTELLRTNEECQKRYREMSNLYVAMNSSWFIQRKEQNWEELRKKLNFRSSRKQVIHRILMKWSAAAIWTVLVVCGVLLWYHQSDDYLLVDQPSFCYVETPSRATSRVLLPDSTVVILNGGSHLKYASNWHGHSSREVFLSGEAYFQVKKNAMKPFFVHAGDLNVKVLGTTFNVSSYPDEETVKVSLIEGSVNVYTESEPQNNRYLSPNQQAVYQKENGKLVVNQVDAAHQMAWTTGKLVFANEKLFDILNKLGKKFDIQVIFESRKVHDEYFSGTIQLDMTIDEILSYLDVDNKYVWHKKGKILIIKDR